MVDKANLRTFFVQSRQPVQVELWGETFHVHRLSALEEYQLDAKKVEHKTDEDRLHNLIVNIVATTRDAEGKPAFDDSDYELLKQAPLSDLLKLFLAHSAKKNL